MDDERLSLDEIRAAAEVHRELGPEYQDAVVESFLEKINKELDARVAARLAATAQAPRTQADHPAAGGRSLAQLKVMALGSAAAGIPSVVAAYLWTTHYPGSSPFHALVVIWVVIVAIYAAAAVRLRRRRDRGERDRKQSAGLSNPLTTVSQTDQTALD